MDASIVPLIDMPVRLWAPKQVLKNQDIGRRGAKIAAGAEQGQDVSAARDEVDFLVEDTYGGGDVGAKSGTTYADVD